MTKNKLQLTSFLRFENGKYILEDPIAYEMFKTAAKINCRNTVLLHKERIFYFINRIKELKHIPESILINIINVDAMYGKELADVLMPNYEWNEIRNQGQVPFARGLSKREGMIDIIYYLDSKVAERITKIKTAIFVCDHGVVECFDADEIVKEF